jgi:integrase
MRYMAQVIALPQLAKSRKSDTPSPKARRGKNVIRFLTAPQVEALIAAVKKLSRNPHRDATMVLLAYRHGLRVSELVDLAWDDVNLDRAEIFVRRRKGSKSTVHPLEGDELRALRKQRRDHPDSRFVFLSELGGPLSVDSFQYLMRKAGEAVGFGFRVHPHMLRHGCGHYLVNAGVNTRTIQDYLGHVDLRHTERYTELDGKRFRGLWRR